MHDWHVAMGDLFIYGINFAGVFSEARSKYRLYWTRNFKWWAKTKSIEYTSELVDELREERKYLHTVEELLFPLAAFVPTRHWELHLSDNLRDLGPRRDTNMFSDERTGY